MSMSSENPFDQVMALGKACAAFEYEVVGEIAGECSKDLTDPVVLFDCGCVDVEFVCDGVDRCGEGRSFSEPTMLCHVNR